MSLTPVVSGDRARQLFTSRSCPALSGAGSSLLGLAAASAASVHLTLGLRISADVLERRGITVVAVDTGELTTVDSGNTL